MWNSFKLSCALRCSEWIFGKISSVWCALNAADCFMEWSWAWSYLECRGWRRSHCPFWHVFNCVDDFMTEQGLEHESVINISMVEMVTMNLCSWWVSQQTDVVKLLFLGCGAQLGAAVYTAEVYAWHGKKTDQQGFSQVSLVQLCSPQGRSSLWLKHCRNAGWNVHLALENAISYLHVSVTLRVVFLLIKKQTAVLRLLEGGLVPAGVGPAQLPVTQPQAMVWQQCQETAPSFVLQRATSPDGSLPGTQEQSLLCAREFLTLPVFCIFCHVFVFRRAFFKA